MRNYLYALAGFTFIFTLNTLHNGTDQNENSRHRRIASQNEPNKKLFSYNGTFSLVEREDCIELEISNSNIESQFEPKEYKWNLQFLGELNANSKIELKQQELLFSRFHSNKVLKLKLLSISTQLPDTFDYYLESHDLWIDEADSTYTFDDTIGKLILIEKRISPSLVYAKSEKRPLQAAILVLDPKKEFKNEELVSCKLTTNFKELKSTQKGCFWIASSTLHETTQKPFCF